MAKQRGNFFGLMTVALLLGSIMKWQGKRVAESGNQWRGNPIYMPRNKKLKGYIKENRRSTFNKNR